MCWVNILVFHHGPQEGHSLPPRFVGCQRSFLELLELCNHPRHLEGWRLVQWPCKARHTHLAGLPWLQVCSGSGGEEGNLAGARRRGGGDLTGAHWAFLSQSLGNFVTNQHVALATHNTTRLTGLVWLWEAEELGEAATFCLFLAWVWSWAGWSSVGPPSDSDGPWGAEPACNLGHTQHTKAYRGRGGSLAGARWLWLGGGGGGGTLLELADCSCNPVAGSVGESGGGGPRWSSLAAWLGLLQTGGKRTFAAASAASCPSPASLAPSLSSLSAVSRQQVCL